MSARGDSCHYLIGCALSRVERGALNVAVISNAGHNLIWEALSRTTFARVFGSAGVGGAVVGAVEDGASGLQAVFIDSAHCRVSIILHIQWCEIAGKFGDQVDF